MSPLDRKYGRPVQYPALAKQFTFDTQMFLNLEINIMNSVQSPFKIYL